jgi:hypothetical protein
MSDRSELNVCIGELRSAAQSLTAAADSLTELFDANGDNAVTIDAEKAKATGETPASTPPVTLAQVRAVLAEKSRDGHTDEIKALLKRHGANRLTELAQDKYAAVLAEAEGLR